MKMSILIPTLYKRSETFLVLLKELHRQINDCNAQEDIEILVEIDNGELPTGTKRNMLLERSHSAYVIQVDDDDSIAPFYIEELLKACDSGKDCAAMSGVITTDGLDERRWYISKDLPYADSHEDGEPIYLRFPNHITLIRSSIAKQFRFPDEYYGEDYAWAKAVHDSGLIKTEYKIERSPIYHYAFKTKK